MKDIKNWQNREPKNKSKKKKWLVIAILITL